MRYSKEKYEELIERNLSMAKIAKELNIGTSTVRHWLKVFGLKTNCSKYNKQTEIYSDEKILETWNDTLSINQCLLLLGVNPSGGAFYHYKKRLEKLGVDMNYDGKSLGGKNAGTLKNREALLKPRRLPRRTLKKFLDDSNIIECCNKCKITDWNNCKLTLHIHHIDSNCKNNRLENLEYLCPNCHNIETYSS